MRKYCFVYTEKNRENVEKKISELGIEAVSDPENADAVICVDPIAETEKDDRLFKKLIAAFGMGSLICYQPMNDLKNLDLDGLERMVTDARAEMEQRFLEFRNAGE